MCRKLFLTFLILSPVVLGNCKFRQNVSSTKEGETLPEETINNLVLDFGFSAKLAQGFLNWTKFVITYDTSGNPNEVYIMNANEEKFHLEFAVKHIPQFKKATPTSFDKDTLFNKGRKALSGGILRTDNGVALDLVSSDILEVQESVRALNFVKSRIHSSSPLQVVYLPVFNQSSAVASSKAAFEQAGYKILSALDLTPGSLAYSTGWAIGRLKKISHEKIDEAYKSGELVSTDILLTDGIPAEIPVLAGVITTVPATPNSHVAILANSYQIPFAFTQNQVLLDEINKLVNKNIYLTAQGNSNVFQGASLEVKNFETATPSQLAEIMKFKQQAQIKFPEKPSRVDIKSKKADAMTIDDAKIFGGKAVNFKVLKMGAPQSYPAEAIGLSFYFWDQFMDQAQVQGESFRSFIANRLNAHRKWPISNVAAMQQTLKEIRDAIKKTKFPAGLEKELIGELKKHKFDSKRKIRFRSSTNIEDGEVFSGAGLYDSYSGCIDSCKGDSDAKSVIEAVQKVFASFYNNNAYSERVRHDVDESKVGMALAVHYSFPDNDELANGVITTDPGDEFSGMTSVIVSQVGAESITNPNAGQKPEKASVTVTQFGDTKDVFFAVDQFSEKKGRGNLVLTSESTYRTLVDHVSSLEKAFVDFYKLKKKPFLDLEYKLVNQSGQSKLIIKQIRMVPQGAGGVSDYYLMGGSSEMCLMQAGSFGNVWDNIVSNHFLKARGTLDFNSGVLSKIVSEKNILRTGTIQLLRQDLTKSVTVDFDRSNVVDAEFKISKELRAGSLSYFGSKQEIIKGRSANLKLGGRFSLDTFSPIVFPNQPPENTLGSKALTLSLSMDLVPAEFKLQSNELAVSLYACAENPPESNVREKRIGDDQVFINVKYRFSKETVGKQESNLAKWEQLTISGLTSKPFSVTDDRARTYAAGHHNFFEVFFIEPDVDPSIPADIKRELKSKNIRFIYAEASLEDRSSIRTISEDFKVTRIGSGVPVGELPFPGGEVDRGDSSDPQEPILDFDVLPLPQGAVGF